MKKKAEKKEEKVEKKVKKDKREFVKEEKGVMIMDLASFPKGLKKTGYVKRNRSVAWWEVEDVATGKLMEVME